jgi:hypothetical protein
VEEIKETTAMRLSRLRALELHNEIVEDAIDDSSSSSSATGAATESTSSSVEDPRRPHGSALKHPHSALKHSHHHQQHADSEDVHFEDQEFHYSYHADSGFGGSYIDENGVIIHADGTYAFPEDEGQHYYQYYAEPSYEYEHVESSGYVNPATGQSLPGRSVYELTTELWLLLPEKYRAQFEANIQKQSLFSMIQAGVSKIMNCYPYFRFVGFRFQFFSGMHHYLHALMHKCTCINSFTRILLFVVFFSFSGS